MIEPTANASDHQGSPKYWRLVVVLMAVYTYAFIDRAILALLVEPIKADLGASDVQMGLMLGVSFAAFFGVFSIPAGHYVDRLNRRRLIMIASVIWAAMTVVCGLSDSLWQLYVGRMGVGVAEAVITPAAFSLIRDAVPARSRGLAFSIFAMSPMVGGATSLIGGAALLKAATAGAFVGLPVIGALMPWQATLVIVGVCGVPFSLLLFLVAEPVRSPRPAAPHNEGMLVGVTVACRYMFSRSSVYLPLAAFAAFGAMIAFTSGAWLPSAFGRKFLLNPQQIGPVLGLLTISGGIAGLFFSGVIMNRIARHNGDIRRYAVIALVVAAIGIGGSVAAPSVTLGYALAGFGMFFVGSSYAVGATILAEVTPVEMMGRVSALYLLVQHLVGQALGPLIVALLADYAFNGSAALPRAFTLSMVIFSLAAIASVLALGRQLRSAKANP